MSIGWLTCIPAVLLPHSLCRLATVNAPANRQMPIASVVMLNFKKKDVDEMYLNKYVKSLENENTKMESVPN
jgi:hypothetical protein